jgi:hypothetical protein
MTSLWYEILPVTLELDQVVWLRRREDGETHPWRIAHQAGMHPNDAVLEHVERLFGERFEPEASIIHSTSWRYCHRTERLLLTYLVVVPQRTWECCEVERARIVAEPVEMGEPVRGDHLHPPSRIEMNNVLAHTLDHLAWLKRFDERIMAVLESGWGEVLETRLPTPAGYVSHACDE